VHLSHWLACPAKVSYWRGSSQPLLPLERRWNLPGAFGVASRWMWPLAMS
jgi:hypothetical protein